MRGSVDRAPPHQGDEDRSRVSCVLTATEKDLTLSRGLGAHEEGLRDRGGALSTRTGYPGTFWAYFLTGGVHLWLA